MAEGARMDARQLTRRGLAALLGAGGRTPAQVLADAPEPLPESLKAGIDPDARLTTPVWINGQGPYAFVVDTGSNHTILAQDLAETLQLPHSGRILINTVAGAEEAPSVRIASADVGKRGGRPTVMAIAPRAALGGSGLLGIDLLDNLRLTLDFRQRRLAVSRSGRRSSDAGSLMVKAQQRSGQLTLVGAEVGELPVIAFVDSGSEGTIGNLALRTLLGSRVQPLSVKDGPLRAPVIGATGLEVLGEVGVVPTLRLGGLSVRFLPVIFADLHTFHVWEIADQPALLIGVDLLRQFESVDLDFGRSEVLFRVPGYSTVTGTRIPAGADLARSIRPKGS
jgi:predicted aspartyl protease